MGDMSSDVARWRERAEAAEKALATHKKLIDGMENELDVMQAERDAALARSMYWENERDKQLARVRELEEAYEAWYQEAHNIELYFRPKLTGALARVAALKEALREMLRTFVPKDAYNEKAQGVIANARRVLEVEVS